MSYILIVMFGFIFLQCTILRNICYLLSVTFLWIYSITMSLQKLAKRVVLIQTYILQYLFSNKPSCSRKNSVFSSTYGFHKLVKSNSQISQQRTCVEINKVAGLHACNLMKKKLQDRCFLRNLWTFRNSFLKVDVDLLIFNK